MVKHFDNSQRTSIIKLLSFYNYWAEVKSKEPEIDNRQLEEILKERPDLMDELKPINAALLMKAIQAWKESGFFAP